MSDTTIALVEDGTLLRPRQFDMGNSEFNAVKKQHSMDAADKMQESKV